jgi:hypothetical protein
MLTITIFFAFSGTKMEYAKALIVAFILDMAIFCAGAGEIPFV